VDLSILIWLPAAAALLGAILPGRAARFSAAAGSLVTLGLSIAVLAQFKTGGGPQFVTDKVWIKELGINYHVAVDGLNLFFILLATLLFAATMVWAALQTWERESMFFLWFGIAETAVLGALMVIAKRKQRLISQRESARPGGQAGQDLLQALLKGFESSGSVLTQDGEMRLGSP